MVLHFSECHTVKWSLLEVEFFHLVICVSVSSVFLHGSTAHFLCSTERELTFWTPRCLSIHSATKEHLGCFQGLVVMNKTTVYICLHDFFLKKQKFFFNSFGNTREILVESYKKCKFRFVENSQTFFQSGYAVSHSPSSEWKLSPHLFQYLVALKYWIFTFLIGV